jgi:DnaJ-domain-containing protein 1
LSTDTEKSTLQEALDTLRRDRHERKSEVLDRARSALAAAHEDMARGIDVDPDVIRELEQSIAEFERFTIERPGLPPEHPVKKIS